MIELTHEQVQAVHDRDIKAIEEISVQFFRKSIDFSVKSILNNDKSLTNLAAINLGAGSVMLELVEKFKKMQEESN